MTIGARVAAYAEAVCSGEIVAGRLVRLTCARHLNDVEHAAERGIWWDEVAAAYAIGFIGSVRQSKGEWAGRPLVLSDWQVFIVGSVFGWMRADGTRRFRKVYTEVARKNGKTTLTAAVGLLLLVGDEEPGAEVYAAAAKRDQAKLCWEEARRMVEQTPALRKRTIINRSTSNLAVLGTNSKFECLSRDADTTSGLNVSGALIDEIHEHRTRDMIDIIETAVASRRQPLIWHSTTAGTEDSRPWQEERGYAVMVAEGVVEDDAEFVYIATIDRDAGDDWRDPAVYIKANPNLGVSVKLEALIEARDKAIAQPSRQNAFRRLHVDEPVEQAERWIEMAAWDACTEPARIGPGDEVFVGLDLSSKIDLTAAVILRIDADGGIDVIPRFWRPEEGLYEAERRDRVPYRQWADSGELVLVEGSMIDPGEIAADLIDWVQGYTVVELAFDAWNAAGAAARLEANGLQTVSMSQGYLTYSEPSHHLEAAIGAGLLRHSGNPILRWMAAQMVVKLGPNDAIRPWKPHSSNLRNDGIVALLMALNRALLYQQETGGGSGFWDFGESA